MTFFDPLLECWIRDSEGKSSPAWERKTAMALTFLEHLYGAYRSGLVEVRSFKPGREGPADQNWFDIEKKGWADELVVYAFTQEQQGKDVYIGVLPRCKRAGDRSAVVQAGVLWADIDFKNVPPAYAKQLGAGNADIIVQSGGGLHCYWQIDELMMLRGHTGEQFTKALKSRQKAVKSDPLHDYPRVLRLPGTTNFKQEIPRCVKLAKWPGKELVNAAPAVATQIQMEIPT